MVWRSEKPTARRKRKKSAARRGRAASTSKRLVMPRAELAESSDEEMDHAIAVPKRASRKVLPVRCCVVVE
jgi:hypothetical protein